jgi:transcription elongation factor
MSQPLVVPDPAQVPAPVRRAPDGVPVPVRGQSGVEWGIDCERLDVYRVAVAFQLQAAAICSGRRLGALRDQLDRASVSIVDRKSRSLLTRVIAMLTRLASRMQLRACGRP